MTLWNIIRDFFVQYIFGGFDSNYNQYGSNFIGQVANSSNGLTNIENTKECMLPISIFDGGMAYNYISLGDWLSTTATIITLCAICVFLFFFVRWLFRLTAGLISGRG